MQQLSGMCTPRRCSAAGSPRRAFPAAPRRTSRRSPAALSSGISSSAPIFKLPSGLELRHFTAGELDFLYREVFEDRVYLRHGVTIRPGDTVIDVGANTGLFTLLSCQLTGPQGRVVAMEPLPDTFALLSANVAAHAAWAAERGEQVCQPVLLNCGAGADGQESAEFTTYSASASGWSTMYPDDGEVWANMQLYMEHVMQGGQGRGEGRRDGGQGNDGSSGGGSEEAAAQQRSFQEPMLARLGRALGRLPPLRPLLRAAGSMYVTAMLTNGRRTHTCKLMPLSRVIREHKLERIDLLKIDVERAELDVLSGLGPGDWSVVRQAVLEVHDLGGRLGEVRRRLAAAGFSRVVSEQDPALAGSRLHLVYAVREGADGGAGYVEG